MRLSVVLSPQSQSGDSVEQPPCLNHGRHWIRHSPDNYVDTRRRDRVPIQVGWEMYSRRHEMRRDCEAGIRVEGCVEIDVKFVRWHGWKPGGVAWNAGEIGFKWESMFGREIPVSLYTIGIAVPFICELPSLEAGMNLEQCAVTRSGCLQPYPSIDLLPSLPQALHLSNTHHRERLIMPLSTIIGYFFPGSRSDAQAKAAADIQDTPRRPDGVPSVRVNNIDPMSPEEVDQHLLRVINRSTSSSRPPITLDSMDDHTRKIVSDLREQLQLGWMVEAVAQAIQKGGSRAGFQAVLQRMDCPDGVPEEMWEEYVGNPEGKYRPLVEMYLAVLPHSA
ncbi:hypothetical protein NMY22_g9738 [Coprinellus aureogranulatus]|nr:hypothetical protein NMY22_g9738 [Coprinellus aureogranulatus]